MTFRQKFHVLHGDVVLGAMAVSTLGSVALKARPDIIWWLTLALSIWIAFTLQQLGDAWKHRKREKTAEHRFVLKNMSILLWLILLLGFIDGLLIMNFLDREVFRLALFIAGLGLLFAALRFLLRRSPYLRLPGELFALFFFMTGTWVGPWAAREVMVGNEVLAVFLMCAAVLFLKLGLVAMHSPAQKSRLGLPSLTVLLGMRSARHLLLGLVAAVLLLSLLQFMVWGTGLYFGLALILDGMAMLYLLMLLWPNAFGPDEWLCWWADLVPLMAFLSLAAKGL
ncbi:MAG: hypothetical protein CSA96_07880 [Bacteroidetes bacterium]|nr:MAG: hypothetical protein CSA96_07880 [Bacteroidota bacterium]